MQPAARPLTRQRATPGPRQRAGTGQQRNPPT
jgi:hypothetical protein